MMKKWFQAVAVGLVVAIGFSFITGFASDCDQIREKVLRLHILANSDSEEDQALKLKVRDRILAESGDLFYQVESKEDAEQITQENLAAITAVAQDEIARQGYGYPVKAEITNMFFETRDYEGFSLPAGKYDAVRITIGEAKGQNWWCVLYPTLCLSAAEPSGEQLQVALGENGADIVEHPQEYQFEFAVVEWFEKLKNQLESK